MRTFKFTIPDRAVALMRPRINMGAIRKFKGAGRGGGPLVYTPYKCKKWQKLVQKSLGNTFPMLKYPVNVYVKFYLKRPGKLSVYALRPDIDNYAKNLLDALGGFIFEDDAHVTHLVATKSWVNKKENERTEVTVCGI